MSKFRWPKGKRPLNGQVEELSSPDTPAISGTFSCSSDGDIGMKILYEPTSQKPEVDIVFIHGLTGNRKSTWTQKSNSIYWPEDLLGTDTPNARIMTFGYDADVFNIKKQVSQNRIRGHARNFLHDLSNVRDNSNTSNLPIIMVAHSLGGLLCKEALSISNTCNNPELQNVVRSTFAIAFCGTPHCGSEAAKWGSSLASLARLTVPLRHPNKAIVNVLEPNSEVLANIEEDFNSLLERRTHDGLQRIHITCFYEEKCVEGVGKIVPESSATFRGMHRSKSIGINANHMDMVRFESASDPGYISVCCEIKRWMQAIDLTCTNPTESSIPQPSPRPCDEEVKPMFFNGFWPSGATTSLKVINNTSGGAIFQGNNMNGPTVFNF